MDENYLDSLLNEVSLDKEIDHKIEEELDSQIQKEKRQYQESKIVSDEDLFNMDLESDIRDIQTEQDLQFSEEQMDELDHLDNLADLDIGDLDFSDIDFDDLDVTKLDGVETDDIDDLLKEFEDDFDIGNLFDSNKQESKSDELEDTITESRNDNIPQDFGGEIDSNDSLKNVGLNANLNEDSFDTDSFLDSLLDDTEVPQTNEIPDISDTSSQTVNEGNGDSSEEELDLLQALEEFGGFGEASAQEEPTTQLTDAENDDLDDILAMLDLEGSSNDFVSNQPEMTENFSETDLTSVNLDDIEELPSDKPNKKKKLMEILFGEPDEDDILSNEELAEIEAKKVAKKEKKEAAKKAKEEKNQAAKEEKTAKNNQKKKKDQEKKLLKAQKKQLLRAEALAEAASEKKLNKPMVIFIFTLFLGGTFMFFLATNNFNYSLAIERATNYFANQKYRKAYDEIVGVEVKEKDEELKDRIYTVMYVERLYESYLNNMELERPEKALDSLLRGVDKYYEHYEEAQELGITSDLDYSFNQIKTVLNDQYGITVEQAIEINQLANYDYVQYIESVAGQADNMDLDVQEDNSAGGEEAITEVDSEDATLPEEEKEEVEE